jgi:uncharacterized protein YciI
MQRYLNTTHRNVAWFKKAADAQELDIKAPYQRNPVWSDLISDEVQQAHVVSQ